MNIYDKRNAFSLLQKEPVPVAFQISRQRELKNEDLGNCSLSQMFNTVTLHNVAWCGIDD